MTQQRILTLCVLGAVVLLGSACTVVEGNGVPAQEERPVRSFSELEVRGDIQVIARVDPDLDAQQGFEVRVSGDENLLPHVHTRVVGQRLVIDTEGVWLDPQVPLEVTLRAQELRSLELASGARVRAEGMDQRSMRVIADGHQSQAWLRGRADQVRLALTNGAQVDALELVTWTARVDAQSHAEVSVCVQDRLEVTASQYAEVQFSCDPYEIFEDVSVDASLRRF
jgi:hypothetical protein